MSETRRYLRSISSPEAYGCPPDDLDGLLQQSYRDKTKQPGAQGTWLLQDSLSLYEVEAVEKLGSLHFDPMLLSEVAILHAASAGLGKPNSHFLDFTDFIGSVPCPQEDSPSPFATLRARHHSLKVVDSGGDVRALIEKMCLGPAQIHSVTKDDLDQCVPSLVAVPLSSEWQKAQELLSKEFDPLNRQRQKSRFGFWVRCGLLTLKSSG